MNIFNVSLKSRTLFRFVLKRKSSYYWPIHNILENMSAEKFESSLTKVSKKSVAVEVIGSGALGAPASVLLHSGDQSFLFNCGEGSQRICVEFKNKVSKIQHVFITYPSWKNCGGLLGTALTLQSTSAEECFIFGSPKIKNLFYGSKKFAKLKKMQLAVKECLPGDTFSEKMIFIKYVHLFENPSDNLKKNLSATKLTPNSTNLNDNEEETLKSSENESFDSDDNADHYLSGYKRQTRRRRKRSHSEAPKTSQSEKPNFALSFICRTPKIRGSLLIEKCMSLNVPNGPLLGKLKMGENITLEDGTIVKSEDVMTPDVPGVIVIVVECPSEEYLDSLLKEPQFYRHQTSVISPEDIAAAVIHFTPPEVVENPKYKEWINRFPNTTKHLYVNEANKSLGLSSVYRQQYKLNILLPDLFPVLEVKPYPSAFSKESECQDLSEKHSLVNIDEEQNESCNEHNFSQSTRCFQKAYFLCNGNNHIKGESLTFLPLLPKNCFDYSLSCIFDQNYFVQLALDSEGFAEGFEMFKNEIKALEEQVVSEKYEYPKIVFLGTGSSQPHKRRNASGILVFLSEEASVLLDCGEGSLTQILRFFGREKTDEILMNLIGIYVSHFHVDHHLGLVNIILHRKLAFQKSEALKLSKNNSTDVYKSNKSDVKSRKLFLLIPSLLENWVHMCSKNFGDFTEQISIIHNSKLCSKCPDKQITDLLKASNLKCIKTTLVQHCVDAYGIMLEHEKGWKITYSGDTKPSTDLIGLGKNSDLLIHEATMEDSMIEDARRKSHCTISQAIEIGRRMNAKFTLLTHFSQRYSHVPFYKDELGKNVGIAFDNLMVSFYQLPYLAKLANFLRQFYAEEYLKLEEKTKVLEIFNKRESTTVLDELSDSTTKKQKLLVS